MREPTGKQLAGSEACSACASGLLLRLENLVELDDHSDLKSEVWKQDRLKRLGEEAKRIPNMGPVFTQAWVQVSDLRLLPDKVITDRKVRRRPTLGSGTAAVKGLVPVIDGAEIDSWPELTTHVSVPK